MLFFTFNSCETLTNVLLYIDRVPSRFTLPRKFGSHFHFPPFKLLQGTWNLHFLSQTSVVNHGIVKYSISYVDLADYCWIFTLKTAFVILLPSTMRFTA